MELKVLVPLETLETNFTHESVCGHQSLRRQGYDLSFRICAQKIIHELTKQTHCSLLQKRQLAFEYTYDDEKRLRDRKRENYNKDAGNDDKPHSSTAKN